MLYSMFSLVTYFIPSSIYLSAPISQSIPLSFPPWYPYVYSPHLCLYFCFANKFIYTIFLGFSGGLDDRETACNAEDLGLISGLGRSSREGLGTHSSILAWRIPWTEEPGGLYPLELQRVRYDWVTNTNYNFSRFHVCTLIMVFFFLHLLLEIL